MAERDFSTTVLGHADSRSSYRFSKYGLRGRRGCATAKAIAKANTLILRKKTLLFALWIYSPSEYKRSD